MAAKVKTLSRIGENRLERSLSPPDDLDRFINSATDALLFKDFEKCLQICESGISQAKLQSNSSEGIEKLCVIAVQAHAELDSWQQVLPFVQNVYGGIECCPQTVLQLCLLLHAQVEDYSQCQALTGVWLRNSNNFSDPEYVELVQAYVRHVMIPQKQGALIPAFLESCPGLTSMQKQDLVSQYANVMQEELKEATRSQANEQEEKSNRKTVGKDLDFFPFVRAMGSIIFRKLPPLSLQAMTKAAVIIMMLYLLGLSTTRGDPNGSYSPVTVLLHCLNRLYHIFV